MPHDAIKCIATPGGYSGPLDFKDFTFTHNKARPTGNALEEVYWIDTHIVTLAKANNNAPIKLGSTITYHNADYVSGTNNRPNKIGYTLHYDSDTGPNVVMLIRQVTKVVNLNMTTTRPGNNPHSAVADANRNTFPNSNGIQLDQVRRVCWNMEASRLKKKP